MTPTLALGMLTVTLASRDSEVGPQPVASSKSAHPRNVVSVLTGSTIEGRVAPCLGSSGALAPAPKRVAELVWFQAFDLLSHEGSG